MSFEKREKIVDDLTLLLKIAAQTERIVTKSIQTNTPALFITNQELEILNIVKEQIMPRIEDIKIRQIMWLYFGGECWKNIARATGLSLWQAERKFSRGMRELKNKICCQKPLSDESILASSKTSNFSTPLDFVNSQSLLTKSISPIMGQYYEEKQGGIAMDRSLLFEFFYPFRSSKFA